MPQIPRATDISRTQVSGQQKVQVADISSVGTGAAAIGGTLDKIASDNHQRKTNYEMAQARTEFLKNSVETESQISQGEEYDTMEERYGNVMAGHRESAASLISDPAARAQFNLDSDLQLTQGRVKMREFAKGVETEYQRGYILEGMETNREAALNGSMLAAIETNDHLVDSAVDMGYLDPDDAAKMKMDWRNDTAAAKIEMMEPEDRLEALNEPWAKNIPSDVRVKLQREAEADGELGEAIDAVYEVRDLGQDDAYTKLEGMNLDPRVQAEAERRLDTYYAREKRNTAASNEELHRSYFHEVRTKGLRIEDIPAEELDKFSVPMLNSMMQAERNYATDQDPITPRTVTDTLNGLYSGGEGSPMALRAYFEDVAHRMSRADYDDWSKTSFDSFANMENDPVFSGTQMINDKVMEVNDGETDAEMTSKYRRQLEKYVFDYQEANPGKKPSGPDMRIAIDEMMLEVPTKEAFWGDAPGGRTLWDDMNADEHGKALSYLRSLDTEAFDQARNMLSNNGTTGYAVRDLAYLFTQMSDADDRGAYEVPREAVTTEPYVQQEQSMPDEVAQMVGRDRPASVVESMGQGATFNDPLAIYNRARRTTGDTE